MTEYLEGKEKVVFVAAARSRRLSGFLEATIRPFAEGCETEPVGYIEGWYVDADVRRRGTGKQRSSRRRAGRGKRDARK